MKESGKKSKRASTGGGGAMVRLKPETPATATAVSQGSGKASKIWEDSRFAHLVNDPRFRGLPKSEKKVKIDSRFKSMFQDERFQVKATVDKYGRPLRKADTDELKKFYELDEDEEEDEEELQREREREERAMEGRDKEVDEEQEKSDGASDSSDDDDDDGLQLTEEEKRMVLSEKIKNRLKDLDVDYARGEAQLYSEDEEDDEDDEEDDEEEDEVFIEHVWGELDADVERTEDSTNRLAVCHMDWDRIRAVDIMVLLSSFLPPGCSIKSVKIYPSEFGKERMQEEEERGPQELTVRTVDGSDEEEEDEEQQKERLREYQLNRLKYYYAVVECDSVETADKIYKECDGVEYESTANKLDLRFIPDEMDFGDDEPKDSCSELPEMGKYVPRIFTTTALNQAKVELTWDENDVERKEFNEKLRDGKWAQMPETELKKYVACSSSSEGEEEEETNGRRNSKKKRSILLIRAPKSDESEEDDDDDDDDDDSDEEAEPRESNKKQDMIAKYKALLSDMKEQEKAEEEEQVGMEFTWKVDDKEESNEADGNESSDRTGSSKLPNDVNPFEKILQKKKEKNKKRKELKKRRKRGELDDDAENGNGSADSESEDDLPYGVDLNDPFFASAFDEKEFGKPQKKQSKSKERDTKSKEEEEREAAEEARRKAELELLLDDGDDNRSHFNLRAIQEREIDLKSVSKSKRRRLLKKSKRQIEEQRNGRADAATAEDDFEIDVEDSRFGAIFSKPEYNIDPTNPAFKKTKGIERIIEHKLKKRRLAENDVREEEVEESGRGVRETKKQKKDVATTMLVKSIKRKIGKSN